MSSQRMDYQDGTTLLEGYYALPDRPTPNTPIVLVIHDWSGKNPFAMKKADDLAKLGYIGFAIDMYGKDKVGTTKEEKVKLMTPLMEDRALLHRRLKAAIEAIASIPNADTNNVAAIGFCFGGLCALDLARTFQNIKGVVSFHGLFIPTPHTVNPITAKILALHGYDDPMVTPDQIDLFAEEMTKAKADWQIHLYGHTMHAFTNPEANDKAFGTVYNEVAKNRAWIAMQNFFNEIF